MSIFDTLEHDWERIRHPRHHQPYNDPNTTQEAAVSLLDTIRNEFHTAVAWGEDEFRRALPTVARAADAADALASSAAAKAVLDAVLSPEDEALVVSFVQRLDQRVRTAEQNMHAGDPQPEPAPPAGPEPVPAGPVVGGQAH